MAEKMKKTKKPRKHKVSKGLHGGGGKVKLTELQKVLMVKGGMAHTRLRKGSMPARPMKKRVLEEL